jgi:hypothetical protein
MDLPLQKHQDPHRHPCEEKGQDHGQQEAEHQIDCQKDACFFKIKDCLLFHCATSVSYSICKMQKNMAAK